MVPLPTTAEPLRRQCAHFLECVRTGRRPRPDGQHGLNVVRILEQVQSGKANAAALASVERVIQFARGKGFCSLISMPVPPLTTALEKFPEEFNARLAQQA